MPDKRWHVDHVLREAQTTGQFRAYEHEEDGPGAHLSSLKSAHPSLYVDCVAQVLSPPS